MVDVKTEIAIALPIDQVASYVCNPDNAPKWYVNIKSAEWQTPKPLSVGSQIAFKAKFLGKDLSYVYEVVEFDENQMTMKTAQGSFPMQTTYTWNRISENETLLKLRNCGQPSGFSKIFALIVASAMKKANNKDLRLLKKILEANS